MDVLIVGAGPQSSNFVGGAVDAVRTVRVGEERITRFPRILAVSPDGVAPAYRQSPSVSEVPVVWHRGSTGEIDIGREPFPYPGSPFRTADLLGLSEDDTGSGMPELKPWHRVFRRDYPSGKKGELSAPEAGLLFIPNQRLYEQALLTFDLSGIPLLDKTTVNSILWDFNSQTANVVTGQGLTIQARSVILETGLRVPRNPLQDLKSRRLLDRQSTDFRSGQIPLSFGTDSDVYLAAQQEGRSFLDRIRTERTLIIGDGVESQNLIEYILGLDQRRSESAGLAILGQH